jgi:hypothetical protein
MIKQVIQLPDYSEYIGKEFIVRSNIDMTKTILKRPILNGVRFIIKKIENSKVTIKISNSKDELESIGMLNYDFERLIKGTESEVKILKKICKMWDDEPEKFIIDDESFWNENRNGDGRGHCINTGFYGIPENHTDKYGMAKPYYEKGKYHISDTIMTLNYKRIDNKLNIYSYQEGQNEFYSKTCYEFILKCKEVELNDWKNRAKKYKNWIFEWILEKQQIPIKTLNKINFEPYQKIKI